MRSKIFSECLRARQRLHGDVGVRQNVMYGLGNGGSELAGTLESYGAREAYGEIGEVAISGAANAHAIDFENAVDARNRIVDLRANSRRGCVEQSVDGTARKAPTHGDDHACHDKGGERIRIAQPVDMIRPAEQDQGQSEHDHAGRPDVSGEVQSIRLQGLAVVFVRDAAEDARSPQVHAPSRTASRRTRRWRAQSRCDERKDAERLRR